MESSAVRPRSRVRDWWRWVTIVPALGALLSAGYLFSRRRRGWSAVLFVMVAAEVLLFSTGVAAIDASHYSTAGGVPLGNYDEYRNGSGVAGLGVMVWWATILLGWLLPGGPGSAPGRPWPEFTARARHLTARYGLIAYAVAFGGVVVLSYGLKAAGVHLGIGPGVMVVDVILLGSLVPLLRRGQLNPADLGLRGTRAGAGAGLAIAALLAYFALAAAYSLLFIHVHTSTGSVTKLYNLRAQTSTVTTLTDCFAMAVSAPVCEEIFFRGLLYRSLANRMPVWAAALIAGSLFGLVHITGYPLITIPVKMIFGVLMCLLYQRTRSLLPTIAVHAAVDGSAADFIFTGNLAVAGIVIGLALLAVLARVAYNAYRDRPDSGPLELTAAALSLPPPTPYTKGRMPW